MAERLTDTRILALNRFDVYGRVVGEMIHDPQTLFPSVYYYTIPSIKPWFVIINHKSRSTLSLCISCKRLNPLIRGNKLTRSRELGEVDPSLLKDFSLIDRKDLPKNLMKYNSLRAEEAPFPLSLSLSFLEQRPGNRKKNLSLSLRGY